MVESVFGSSFMVYGRGGPSSASLGLADSSKVNKLASRYKSVNLSAPKQGRQGRQVLRHRAPRHCTSAKSRDFRDLSANSSRNASAKRHDFRDSCPPRDAFSRNDSAKRRGFRVSRLSTCAISGTARPSKVAISGRLVRQHGVCAMVRLCRG